MMYKTKKVTYDRRNDVLYVSFDSDRGQSYGSGEENGIEEMLDMDTDQVTGLMIFYPRLRQQERQSALDQKGYNLHLNELCKA